MKLVITTNHSSNFTYYPADPDMTLGQFVQKLPVPQFHFIDFLEKREEPAYKKIYTPLKDYNKKIRDYGLK